MARSVYFSAAFAVVTLIAQSNNKSILFCLVCFVKENFCDVNIAKESVKDRKASLFQLTDV